MENWVRGRELHPPIPEAIRLYILCDSMNWAHLPLPGGIYAQSTKLIDQFEIIFRRIARKRADDEAKHKREMEAGRRRKGR